MDNHGVPLHRPRRRRRRRWQAPPGSAIATVGVRGGGGLSGMSDRAPLLLAPQQHRFPPLLRVAGGATSGGVRGLINDDAGNRADGGRRSTKNVGLGAGRKCNTSSSSIDGSGGGSTADDAVNLGGEAFVRGGHTGEQDDQVPSGDTGRQSAGTRTRGGRGSGTHTPRSGGGASGASNGSGRRRAGESPTAPGSASTGVRRINGPRGRFPPLPGTATKRAKHDGKP